jgi:hypothetical protein
MPYLVNKFLSDNINKLNILKSVNHLIQFPVIIPDFLIHTWPLVQIKSKWNTNYVISFPGFFLGNKLCE